MSYILEKSCNTSKTQQKERVKTIGTDLVAGNDAVLISGKDTNVLASKIAADENIQITAGSGASISIITREMHPVDLIVPIAETWTN